MMRHFADVLLFGIKGGGKCGSASALVIYFMATSFDVEVSCRDY